MSDRTFHILVWVAALIASAVFWYMLALNIAHASARWDIGYTVTTKHPSNVVIRWSLDCDGHERTGQVEATTPVTKHLWVGSPHHCDLRVVAWNPPPGRQHPTVTTWVRP